MSEEPRRWHPTAREKYKSKLENAVRDQLTGLHNRRYLVNEMNKIKPEDKFSIVMFDIDDFKKVNDTYGHKMGDIVLETVGRELIGSVREGDIVARYGGEEFVLIWVFTSLDATKTIKWSYDW